MNQTATRRGFLKGAIGLGLVASLPRSAFALQGHAVVADEAWASVLDLGDRTWGVISKPLEGSFVTTCNGGAIAGRERVLAFDGYNQDEGAAWVGQQIEALAGRWPTDVVLSHHHGDHVAGVGGFASGGHEPQLWLTQAIRDRLTNAEGAAAALLEKANILSPTESTELDLGGRTVVLTPTSGHTPSDIVARVDDRVTFCGDLVWNDLFPNYMDAIPTELSRSVAAIVGDAATIRVPGHGPLPDSARLRQFQAVLDAIERQGRASFEAGRTPSEAAAGFTLPESVGSWVLFNPRYFETAFTAWHRELAG